MHRNTYVVVSILAVLAALVVGVNVGRKITPLQVPETPSPTPSLVVSLSPAIQTFVNSSCGFTITYSDPYTLMDSASGSAVLNYPNDPTKSIVMACQKSIPRPAIAAENIETVFLPSKSGASVSASLYRNQSSKDGQPVDALVFTHPTKKTDVFFAGYGEAFNALIRTIIVTP